jgi:5-methylcytosine-specific restriction protein A
MATAAQKQCQHPGCGRLCSGRFCILHKDDAEQSAKTFDRMRGSATLRGYGRHWQRLRKMILARDPICKIAKLCVGDYPGALPAPSTVVDHIIPKRSGGTDSPDNLQGSCKTDHDHKTRTEDSALAKRDTAKRFAVLLLFVLLLAARSSATPALIHQCSDSQQGAAQCSFSVSVHDLLVIGGSVFASYGAGDSLFNFGLGQLFAVSEGQTDPCHTCFGPPYTFSMGATWVSAATGGSDTLKVQPTQFSVAANVIALSFSGIDRSNHPQDATASTTTHAIGGTTLTWTAGPSGSIPAIEGETYDAFSEWSISGAPGTYATCAGGIVTNFPNELIVCISTASPVVKGVAIAFKNDGTTGGTGTARRRSQVIHYDGLARQIPAIWRRRSRLELVCKEKKG